MLNRKKGRGKKNGHRETGTDSGDASVGASGDAGGGSGGIPYNSSTFKGAARPSVKLSVPLTAPAVISLTTTGTLGSYIPGSFSVRSINHQTAKPAELPRLTQEDALRGWRTALLAGNEEGMVELRSIFITNHVLHPEQEAICYAHGALYGPRQSIQTSPDHLIPVLNCTCGFYALKRITTYGSTFGTTAAVLLQVDLKGRIVEATAGFRASHQSIIAGWLPEVCAMAGCSERAYKVQLADPLGVAELSPMTPSPSSGFVSPVGWANPMYSFGWTWTACVRHIDPDRPSLSPAEISNRLGIEMRWADERAIAAIASKQMMEELSRKRAETPPPFLPRAY